VGWEARVSEEKKKTTNKRGMTFQKSVVWGKSRGWGRRAHRLGQKLLRPERPERSVLIKNHPANAVGEKEADLGGSLTLGLSLRSCGGEKRGGGRINE